MNDVWTPRSAPFDRELTPSQSAAVAADFLANLTPSQSAAVATARDVWLSAGGVIDEFSDVTMVRFCVGNKWDATKTAAQLRRTAAWRRVARAGGKSPDSYRAAFLEGRTLLSFELVRRVFSMSLVIPALGCSRAGDLVHYALHGQLDQQRFFSEVSVTCTARSPHQPLPR